MDRGGRTEAGPSDARAVAPYRCATWAARLLPSRWTIGASRAAGLVAGAALSKQRAMLERHLRRVDPALSVAQAKRASRAGMSSYARYWIESLRLPSRRAPEITAGFRHDGYHHILDALAHGNGAILALPHLGGWEWAGRWLADRGHRVSVVVERLEPQAVYEWFVDLREGLGMKVVPLDTGAGTEVLAALKRNEIVCLLSDRDIGGTGVEVEFFGERTSLPGGAALIGLRSGAPILPTAVYFTDAPNGHVAIVEPPIEVARTTDGLRADVARVTDELARRLEGLIGRAPTQWHLLQPNWPSDRSTQPLAAAAVEGDSPDRGSTVAAGFDGIGLGPTEGGVRNVR